MGKKLQFLKSMWKKQCIIAMFYRIRANACDRVLLSWVLYNSENVSETFRVETKGRVHLYSNSLACTEQELKTFKIRETCDWKMRLITLPLRNPVKISSGGFQLFQMITTHLKYLIGLFSWPDVDFIKNLLWRITKSKALTDKYHLFHVVWRLSCCSLCRIVRNIKTYCIHQNSLERLYDLYTFLT